VYPKRLALLVLLGIAPFASAPPAVAQGQVVPAVDLQNEVLDALPNLRAPTLGGKQLWEDHLHFRGWRIQRNVVTGHYRLLDHGDFRKAFGSYERCAAQLEKAKQDHGLEPYRGKAVILMHGLARTRTSMAGMARFLSQQGGYHVYNMSYASTRGDVATHARCLESVIDHLEAVEEINFVGHSLGNLVVRYYLSDLKRKNKQVPARHRIRRIVMLAPPNNGAKLAERVGRNKVFEFVVGPSGAQIASNWKELDTLLGVPSCKVGIIAGGGGSDSVRNPLVQGDDDIVVSVEETRLPGASDFIVLPVVHSFLMDDEHVQQCALRFFRHGYFVSAHQRQPIPR
jgi:pimeloyl-ACP methyl ester carboxylesterase